MSNQGQAIRQTLPMEASFYPASVSGCGRCPLSVDVNTINNLEQSIMGFSRAKQSAMASARPAEAMNDMPPMPTPPAPQSMQSMVQSMISAPQAPSMITQPASLAAVAAAAAPGAAAVQAPAQSIVNAMLPSPAAGGMGRMKAEFIDFGSSRNHELLQTLKAGSKQSAATTERPLKRSTNVRVHKQKKTKTGRRKAHDDQDDDEDVDVEEVEEDMNEDDDEDEDEEEEKKPRRKRRSKRRSTKKSKRRAHKKQRRMTHAGTGRTKHKLNKTKWSGRGSHHHKGSGRLSELASSCGCQKRAPKKKVGKYDKITRAAQVPRSWPPVPSSRADIELLKSRKYRKLPVGFSRERSQKTSKRGKRARH